MMDTDQLREELNKGTFDERLQDIYVDSSMVLLQRKRYLRAIESFEKHFGHEPIEIYSAPGRSEIGGNHTDHQHGEVLVAAINVDAIALVHKTEDNKVCVAFDGYDEISVFLDDLEAKKEEEGTTKALMKGVLCGVKKLGYRIGGFQAFLTSDVLVGAGISSSAAVETVFGTILSGLYNQMQISPVEIAKIGQYAENVYFGKPCGLMDQMASSVGNLVHIDFEQEENPVIQKIECDFTAFGYCLCITDTKSSHADCTDEYAAVPREMKQAAGVFGCEVLRQVPKTEILGKIQKIREVAGDRAALRAIHFVTENERVGQQVKALKIGEFQTFLNLVKASGDSSYKYLQNVYMNQDIEHQNVSLALALSEVVLDDNGVCRVHGGGFAGTIQAFVKKEAVLSYCNYMNEIFGKDSCQVYQIRKYGGIRVL